MAVVANTRIKLRGGNHETDDLGTYNMDRLIGSIYSIRLVCYNYT